MKIATIVGARPQFIKTSLISSKLRETDAEILIHTGQHYDKNLSDSFFKELNIPNPEFNLGIGSGSHGKQTGLMLVAIAELLEENQPDIVIVYGDTNSTLAGALAATKLNIPIAHIEAGLRSYNRAMPEEINRILTDHISKLLFCPTIQSMDNLKSEGILNGVINCGDVMEEVFSNVFNRIKKNDNNLYGYMTLHRAENTDEKTILMKRLTQVGDLDIEIIWPIHPRTQKQIKQFKLNIPDNIRVIQPKGYYNNVELLINADYVLTDSGGLQKEAYWAGVPCFTLRNETEWVETVHLGWNTLISKGDNLKEIILNNNIPQKKFKFNKMGSQSQLIIKTIKSYIHNN